MKIYPPSLAQAQFLKIFDFSSPLAGAQQINYINSLETSNLAGNLSDPRDGQPVLESANSTESD